MLVWTSDKQTGTKDNPVATALSTQFDPIFRKHAEPLGIPTALMRALSKKESGQNPLDNRGSAAGLMQVVSIVRESFNSRHGTSFLRGDLLDPDVNVMIASDQIRRIMDSYQKNHPGARNLQPDWSNPEYAKLVMAGWNSGHSEAGGVGKVADFLEARNIPVTHDNVFAFASAAGATRHLSNAAKQQFQRDVVSLFRAQPDAPKANPLLMIGLLSFLAWGVYKLLGD